MSTPPRRSRRWVVWGVALALFSLPAVAFAFVVSTNVYFVGADVVETEDVYVAASSARVLGTIEGDLVIAAGNITITGTVTGDLVVASQGTVTIDGRVGGSVRGLARDVRVPGSVGDDVAVLALTVDVSGDVGRDLLLLAATADSTGAVGRDVLGRVQSARLDGAVGGDVDVLVERLTLGAGLDAGGDVIYRSGSDASVSSGAEIAGSLSRLPSTGSFVVRSILLFVNLLHLLSFVFAGLLLLWVFQPSMSAAVEEIEQHPIRSIGIGLATIVLLPVVVVLFVFSLIGIPVGVLLLVLMALALFFAPIPAVTALGGRILRDRGALFGAFLLGAVIWRGAMWLLPWLALVVYGLSVAAGLGGALVAARSRRRTETPSQELVPVKSRSEDRGDIPDGWEPPLSPTAGSLATEEDTNDEEVDEG